MKPRLSPEELNQFLRQAFPDRAQNDLAKVLSVGPGHAQMRLVPGKANLRPGGIVSGPTLMGLADSAAYAVVLAHIGLVAMAVTSQLNYTFLRGCDFGPVTADAHLLRLGRRLAVVDVRLWTGSADRPVGQANVTYAIPDSATGHPQIPQ